MLPFILETFQAVNYTLPYGIPHDAFFTTWGIIREFAIICFCFGWGAKALTDYFLERIKSKKEAGACQG